MPRDTYSILLLISTHMNSLYITQEIDLSILGIIHLIRKIVKTFSLIFKDKDRYFHQKKTSNKLGRCISCRIPGLIEWYFDSLNKLYLPRTKPQTFWLNASLDITVVNISRNEGHIIIACDNMNQRLNVTIY